MIIGVCGYVSSGSSAVSDYLKEFPNVNVLDEAELQLIYGPDGLEDLDYQLNVHCSKHLSSVVAIERFRRHMYVLHINKIKNKQRRKELIRITEKYINSITDTVWKGWGLSDNILFCTDKYRSPKLSLLKYRIGRWISIRAHYKFHIKWTKYPVHDMEFAIRPENFEKKTKAFVKCILKFYGADYSKPIIIDQAFCGNNPEKSFKFFDDPYAIVVDRDPRDVYLFAKTFLQSKGVYLIPADNVKDFVRYYKKMRINNSGASKRVLRIQFEDLVYEYEKTIKIIDCFLGFNNSDRNRKIFDPKLSIANTQVFRKIKDYNDDIKYIEKELKEYLYPFEKYGDVDSSGEMFYGKSPLNR